MEPAVAEPPNCSLKITLALLDKSITLNDKGLTEVGPVKHGQSRQRAEGRLQRYVVWTGTDERKKIKIDRMMEKWGGGAIKLEMVCSPQCVHVGEYYRGKRWRSWGDVTRKLPQLGGDWLVTDVSSRPPPFSSSVQRWKVDQLHRENVLHVAETGVGPVSKCSNQFYIEP